MLHDLDYDRAWDKVSQRFWHRRRELVIHFALFVGVQLLMFLRYWVAAPCFLLTIGRSSSCAIWVSTSYHIPPSTGQLFSSSIS